jgi:predicted GNAT family N-acyltransferase
MQASSMINVLAINFGHELMPAAYALRHDVFVVEQGIAEELERDDADKMATHLVALLDGRVVATLRIVHQGTTAKIGRMAVYARMRGKGIGRELMEFAMSPAASAGVDEIVLGAQVTARDFYKRLGYVEAGPVFDDAGLPHVMMRRNFRT